MAYDLRPTTRHTLPLVALLGLALAGVPTGCQTATEPGPAVGDDITHTDEQATQSAEASASVMQEAAPGPATAQSATQEAGDAGQGATGAETTEASAPPQSSAIAMATELAGRGLPEPAFDFGTEGIEPGQILLPFDVALDGDGNVIVSDSKGVQKFTAEGEFLLQVGPGEIAAAQGIAAAPDGTIYVSGLDDVVHVFDGEGQKTATIGEPGGAPGQLLQPVDVALDREGNVYVADASNSRVEKYAPDGTHLLTIGEKGTQSGQFTSPRVVTVDDAGRVYVGMGDDFLVQRFGPNGDYLDSLGKSYADESMWRVAGLATDEGGNLYVSRAILHAIQCFEAGGDGGLLWELGELGRAPGEFNTPGGMAVRGTRLYVADTTNNRVQVLELVHLGE